MTKCFRQHQDTHIQPTFITSSTSSFWQSHNSSQPSLLLWPWKDLFLVPVAFKTPIPLFSCSKKVIRFFLFHLKQKTIDWTFFFFHIGNVLICRSSEHSSRTSVTQGASWTKHNCQLSEFYVFGRFTQKNTRKRKTDIYVDWTGKKVQGEDVAASSELLKANTTLTSLCLISKKTKRKEKTKNQRRIGLQPMRLEMREQKKWARSWKWTQHWRNLIWEVRIKEFERRERNKKEEE